MTAVLESDGAAIPVTDDAADSAAAVIAEPDGAIAAAAPATAAVGSADPLGATWDGTATNFAVFSSVASRVELCLFDEQGERRLDLAEVTQHIWHGRVEHAGPGTRYAFRVHGPWNPEAGLRCNPAKLLLDPYARHLAGNLRGTPAMLPYAPDSDGEARSDEDNAGAMPLAVVTDDRFDWGGDRPLARPWRVLVMYEMHVKGFTMRHPGVPADLRGTYAGLAHPAAIEHLLRLGVTAVELMPVQAFVHEGTLVDRGLSNYWGYNPIGYFAPHPEYVSEGGRANPVREFKQMVKALHAAGLEVILDVVYNHTAEGNHLGPMLSFRGLDNTAYYRLVDGSPRHYFDFTGTGNTLNLRHPQVLQLVLDSLRYWVTEMHVDGFRFDLAVSLGRGVHDFDAWSPFLAAVHQDPVLRCVRLIAEPWDIGDGGYRVGDFPIRWAEWNGQFRDTVRDFWRSETVALRDFATRLAGSSDLFSDDGRLPQASVNLITSHDGFTLSDLVSYNEKHNEANGEGNQDGEGHNRSWNLGAEGPTDDADVQTRRRRQRRNLITTLLLAQGVPLIVHGDELGRTQQGNNNAYCQDGPMSWIDWEAADTGLIAFTARAIALRRTHEVLRRTRWLHDHRDERNGHVAAQWFAPEGPFMAEEHWADGDRKAITLVLDGSVPAGTGLDPDGQSLCICFNARLEPATFVLPPCPTGEAWWVALDSTTDEPPARDAVAAGSTCTVPDLGLLVLTSRPAATTEV